MLQIVCNFTLVSNFSVCSVLTESSHIAVPSTHTIQRPSHSLQSIGNNWTQSRRGWGPHVLVSPSTCSSHENIELVQCRAGTSTHTLGIAQEFAKEEDSHKFPRPSTHFGRREGSHHRSHTKTSPSAASSTSTLSAPTRHEHANSSLPILHWSQEAHLLVVTGDAVNLDSGTSLDSLLHKIGRSLLPTPIASGQTPKPDLSRPTLSVQSAPLQTQSVIPPIPTSRR